MKFLSLATLAGLAGIVNHADGVVIPSRWPRSPNNATQLNGFTFTAQDFKYLQSANSLDLPLLQSLGLNQNLDVLFFQNIFNTQSFNLNSLLQFQQLSTLLNIAQSGVLQGVDLSTISLGALNLGLMGAIGGVNLDQFIPEASTTQIQTIANGVTTTVIISNKA